MIFISSRADRYLLKPIVQRLGETIGKWENGDWEDFILSSKYLIVLGDRYETCEVSLNAFHLGLPIIHIQGGECTPCSKDDIYRDCITRMASLHFPPTREAALRVGQIQPGAMVIPVGAVGSEIATTLVPHGQAALQDMGFRFGEKTWLVTFHPQPKEDVQELIDALKEEGGEVIWTWPNKDPGWEQVSSTVEAAGFTMYEDLTMPVYLSLMHYVTAVVGNSSSGLIEAPSIGAQTINIGVRQTGRPQATSVTSIACKKADIAAALHLCHYMPVFPKENPYYKPGTIDTIVREIRARYA